MFAETDQWRWMVVVGVTLLAVMLWIGMIMAGGTAIGNEAALLPLGILGAAGFGSVVWHAMLRKPWALLTLTVIGPCLLTMSLRARQVGAPTLDFPVILKIIVWAGMTVPAIVNFGCMRQYLTDRVVAAFSCYCLVILLSVVYSPAPLISGLAAFAMTLYLIYACVLVSSVPERTIILVLLWAFSATCAVHLLSAVVTPDIGWYSGADPFAPVTVHAPPEVETVRLMGFAGQPNNLGRITSVFVLLIFTAAYRGYLKPMLWIPNAGLAMLILILTQSRGTLAGVVVGFLLVLPKRLLVFLLGLGTVLALSVMVTGQLTAILSLVGRGGDANEAVDMAGRAELWDFTWGLIKQHPLIGYGFNSFEVYASQFWTGQVEAGVAAHNNYLSVLYCTGIAGMVPFAVGFLILLYRWLVTPDPPRDFWVISALICGYAEMDVLSLFQFVPSFVFFIVVIQEAHRNLLRDDYASIGAHFSDEPSSPYFGR